jgi:hypothetical protein
MAPVEVVGVDLDPSAPQLDRIGLFDGQEIGDAIRRGDDLGGLPAALGDSVRALLAVEHQIVEPAYGQPLNDGERLALLSVLVVGPGDTTPISPGQLFERLGVGAPGIVLRLRHLGRP